MTKKLKLGAVGIGGMFTGYASVFLDHPEVEIVAVCDIVEEKAKNFAELHSIQHFYTDFTDLLAHAEIDAVIICTSNLFHSIISIAALQAGKHVFCEKPDAVNPIEAQKMADAAKQSGKLLMVMRNNRFLPAAQFLHKFIKNRHMGEIYTGRCGWIRRRGIPGKGGWFTTKELSGGGPLIDLGIHYIDLAVWLMGNPSAQSVSGSTYRKFADTSIVDSIHSAFGEKQEEGTFDVEDLATGFVRFHNGASLQFECSWASNIEEELSFIELRGTKAGFSFKNNKLKIFSEIEGVLCDIDPKIVPGLSAHRLNLEHFIECIQGRAVPVFDPKEGVNIIKIISAIYESSDSGKEVQV